MSSVQNDPLLQVETTCGSLLYELQIIWDEVGETDAERDKMLLELEQECLEVYRRKVDHANRSRAQLRQAIADSEAELAAICSAMGELPVHIRQSDQKSGNLKEELKQIIPQLDEMRKRRIDRSSQFLEVLEQIEKLSNAIYSSEYNQPKIVVDEADLSLRKLEDLHRQLNVLQNEKTNRLKLVHDYLYTLTSLCSVLGIDFKQIVNEVHPSLVNSDGPKNITNKTIEELAAAIENLREVKLKRMQRLQDLASTMLELWNLMDTPIEEQQMFQNITSNIAASEHEITEPNTLSVDSISFVEAEVSRLEELKSSKLKELVLKKRSELEEVCRKTHLIPEDDTSIEYAIEAIESGATDAACVLEQIEIQVCKVKEEALMRKEILERVEKWLSACDEECWLEEYNRDENRYNAGRGAHLTLKRAEKARSLASKLPGMVEALALKTVIWEKERGIEFTYDGVRLLSMLDDYNMLRQEKEQERRRQRDQKKLQGQLLAEQEALYGSKPSPSKPQSTRKGPRMSTGGASNRRLSLGGAMLQTPKHDPLKATPQNRATRKSDRVQHNEQSFLQDDGFGALSVGRRGLDIAGLPVKKLSTGSANPPEPEPTPHFRKPFSPISSKAPPQMDNHNMQRAEVPVENFPFSTPLKKASITDEVERTPRITVPPEPTPHFRKPFSPISSKAPPQMDNHNMQRAEVPVENFPFSTPLKKASVADEVERTPRAPITVPCTPSTASVPMQTAITPAPCLAPAALNLTARAGEEDALEEIEYSFEERRAGFVLPKAYIKKSMIRV